MTTACPPHEAYLTHSLTPVSTLAARLIFGFAFSATSIEDSGEGIQSWETAAAYIRRKSRERRLRNRTIGAPDELIARLLFLFLASGNARALRLVRRGERRV